MDRLGRYELLAKLATGGMGEIFLARLSGEGGFEKKVVIKRLLPELVPAGQYVQMFLDEARLTARLTHPNVCEVHELGVDQGQYFIVMPYLEGVPWSKVMRRHGDPREHQRLVAGALAQACTGLHHAHELTDDVGVPLNVVHRDISPSNLFVTTDGIVKVLDFGIAKARIATSVTEKGMLKGKLAYMSPEQMGDGAVDRRSDIFCLGIVLHESITGRRLFHREPAMRAAEAVLSGDIPEPTAIDPAVAPALAAVAMRALSRDPARRYATASEMANALQAALPNPYAPPDIATVIRTRFAGDLQARAAEVTAATTRPLRVAKPEKKKRPIVPIVLAATVAVSAVLVVSLYDCDSSEPPTLPSPLRGEGSSTPEPTAESPSPPTPSPPTPSPPTPSPPTPAPPPSKPKPAAPGYVSIESMPFATIYVDGAKLGPTPIIKHKLAPGKHTIRATLADGRKQSRTVRVESGRTAPPITFSW